MQERRLGQASKLGKKLLVQWRNSGLAGGVQGNPRVAPEQTLSVECFRTRSRQGLSAKFGFECWPNSEDEFVLYILGTT